MAEETKQLETTAASGSRLLAPCCCRFFSGTPMCSRCYAEKVLKPMEELEAALAEIRRANSGKQQHVVRGQSRTYPVPVDAVAEARNAATSRKKVGVRNCSS